MNTYWNGTLIGDARQGARRLRRQGLVFSVVLLLLALLPGSAAWAAPAGAAAPHLNVPGRAAGPTDPHEVQTFLDSLIGEQLAQTHIAGATVAVVKDGALLFARGYGYADVAHQQPVVADKTLFRIGSVSKLFTWTAVMQLVQAGQLDLHTDINHYLHGFQIPATFPQPITLEHLLTHTPGFEDRGGFYTANPAELQPLATYLAQHMPARVRPPGEVTAYSNYGAALAGLIVEQVSGMPFDQYVAQHILQPLAMAHATFQQPVPADLAPAVTHGYMYDAAGYHEEPFEDIQVGPAGALSATATDVAQFMIAHLQNGQLGSNRILGAATAAVMHQQHFTNDPRVAGMAYGFLQMDANGRQIIWHPGDTVLFHSALLLVPQEQVGIFVSYNTATAAVAPYQLVRAFLDHYYPVAPAPTPGLPGTQERIRQVVGDYLQTRAPVTRWTKLLSLLEPVSVSDAGNGRLRTKGTVNFGTLGTEVREWVEVDPYVFRQVGGTEQLVFRADNAGRVTTMLGGNLPIEAFERLPWYEAPPFQNGVLVVCLLLFLSVVAGLWRGAIGWLRNLRRARTLAPTPSPPAGRLPQVARVLVTVVSLLNLYFMAWFITTFFSYMQKPWDFPSLLSVALGLPLVAAVLAVGLVGMTVVIWKNGYWTTLRRVHYTLVTVAALVFVWWLNYWNLLGFHL